MAVLINPLTREDRYREHFGVLLAHEPDVRWYPDLGDPTEIEYVIAWLMPRSVLAEMTNLRAILSLGAGAEQWQQDGMPDVPVVRLADPAMSDEMAAYCVSWVVPHQRGLNESMMLQRQHRWESPTSRRDVEDYTVGVLGYGTIGSRIARAFRDLGFPVRAWSRSGRDEQDVVHHAGLSELDDFLGACDAIINVLPATPQTIGLLDAERFAAFRSGALFVNIGRGSVIADDAALIAALDAGGLVHAVLDVTEPEPPADDSPLFDHPAITLTMHTAGVTRVASAARLIADNLAKLRAGESVEPLLDRSRGY